MGKLKYFVVWKGRQTGIFETWEQCKEQVYKFPGGEFKGFADKTIAEIAFEKGPQFVFTPEYKKHRASLLECILIPCICVDAACNIFTGNVEFRAVLLPDMRELFSCGPFEKGSINLGEFMAIVTALQYCADHSLNLPIYSDSRVAMLWVELKAIHSSVVRGIDNEPLFKLIDDALAWLRNHSFTHSIIKWDTFKWGENPADYGRK